MTMSGDRLVAALAQRLAGGAGEARRSADVRDPLAAATAGGAGDLLLSRRGDPPAEVMPQGAGRISGARTQIRELAASGAGHRRTVPQGEGRSSW
jgi:hypothetical protein